MLKTKKIVFLICLFLLSVNSLSIAQQAQFLDYINHPWVDSVLSTLNEREKIAQSIWVAAWSNKDISHKVELSRVISEYRPGGLIFFQGTAADQAEMINYYQDLSEVPLMIATDGEWGPGMRLDNITDFPFQMTLGAIRDDSLIYMMGAEIARQLRLCGVNQNLAPVADINNNPSNPVINYRSFGENPERVSRKSLMYARGMQDNGIAATAKHFPGHGDTNTDSHHALPLINHSRQRFDTLELLPFRHLIDGGIASVMSAHLNIPALDSTPDLPSTLSPVILKNLLRDDLGFRGLVISDAMNMKGVTGMFPGGKADGLAYAAGNDVIEFVEDPGRAIDEIVSLLKNGRISSRDIEMKCRRILALKYWCRLDKYENIDPTEIDSRINSSASKALIHDLYSGALTLLRNDNNLLPLKYPEQLRIACLTVNGETNSAFSNMVKHYAKASSFSWPGKLSQRALLDTLDSFDLVLTHIAGTDQRPYRNFGIDMPLSSFLAELANTVNQVSIYAGNPYALEKLPVLFESRGLILSYQDNIYTQEIAAQIIFGAKGAHGCLPVSINNEYPEGFGLRTAGELRLQYAYPENAGLDSQKLNQSIDSIVNAGLEAGAFPGCEVIAARKGKVIFHKAYGHHTYFARQEVVPGDLYDLASVTKVAAPVAGLMLLDDKGLFDPDLTLSDYMPFFKRSDKSDLVIRDILSHQAGLAAWIPYWKKTVKEDGSYKSRYLKRQKRGHFNLEVAENLYLRDCFKKKIYREIRKSELGDTKYLYSGLAFYLFPEIISDLSGQPYDQFLREKIYLPVGAYSINFNPSSDYPLRLIAPTEHDTLFRHKTIQGWVHDEGAAMMGGVSGNAGLFATAEDLLKLFEMYRRKGSYGGRQVISPQTIEEYTSCQFPGNNNRRGMGFDKPQLPDTLIKGPDRYPCESASPPSYGYSGFTGTFAWVDPAKEISYIFLSNRVYPTRSNNLISSMNIRTSILQSIYDSIID